MILFWIGAKDEFRSKLWNGFTNYFCPIFGTVLFIVEGLALIARAINFIAL